VFRKARKVVEPLNEALELMAEDDPIQPGITPLYIVLHETKVRAELAHIRCRCGIPTI
jgi:hypothetical protein